MSLKSFGSNTLTERRDFSSAVLGPSSGAGAGAGASEESLSVEEVMYGVQSLRGGGQSRPT